MGLKLACFLHLSACRNRLGDGHKQQERHIGQTPKTATKQKLVDVQSVLDEILIMVHRAFPL